MGFLWLIVRCNLDYIDNIRGPTRQRLREDPFINLVPKHIGTKPPSNNPEQMSEELITSFNETVEYHKNRTFYSRGKKAYAYLFRSV